MKISVFVAAALILAVEAAFYLFNPQPNFYTHELSQSGLHLWNRSPLYPQWRLNSRGEYGREEHPQVKADAAKTRILVVGTLLSVSVKDVLSRTLAEDGIDAELIDCRVAMSDILNSYYVYVERCGPRYEGVEYVLLQTSTNLELAGIPLFPPQVPAEIKNISTLRLLSSKPVRSTTLDELLREFGIERIPGTGLDSGVVAEINRRHQPRYFGYYYSNIIRYFENRSILQNIRTLDGRIDTGASVQYSIEILKRLKAETRSRGAEFVVLNFPSKTFDYQNRLNLGISVDDVTEFRTSLLFRRDLDKEREVFQRIEPLLMEFKAKAALDNIPFVDMTEEFIRYPLDELYDWDNFSPSNRAVEIAADALAATIKK